MAEDGKSVPPTPGIIWGQDIQRPRAIHPPPEIVPYLQGLANGLNGFAAQRRRSIEYYIQVFELDRESFLQRRGNRSSIGWEQAIQENLDNQNGRAGDGVYMKPYNINKALTLELMMTCAIFRLLSPTNARANCKLKYGWPVNFAPPRKPDIRVDCDDFIFHVEVSAKIDMDDKYFGDELESTLNHIKNNDVIWALLVTEWDYKKARSSQRYKEFKHDRQADLENCHLIIMSLQEMAELSATLAFDADFNSGKKRLNPAQVQELFEALHLAQETKEEKEEEDKKEKSKQKKKSKKKGKQKGATKKKKKVEINLRDTWIKATQRLLKGQPALAPEPAGEPENPPPPAG